MRFHLPAWISFLIAAAAATTTSTTVVVVIVFLHFALRSFNLPNKYNAVEENLAQISQSSWIFPVDLFYSSVDQARIRHRIYMHM